MEEGKLIILIIRNKYEFKRNRVRADSFNINIMNNLHIVIILNVIVIYFQF
jgi:hypothetical protein